MKADELDLTKIYKISTLTNQDDPQERIVTIPTAAMGMLRHELIETLGIERTKGFLLRHGWHCGVKDAQKALEMDWDSKKELLFVGPRMHTLHGYLEEVDVLVAEVDFSNGTMHHEAIWKNSYEAEEHLQRFGLAHEPVCHTLVGYASGYLSTILGKKVITKEVKCKAMGHEYCHAVCRTVEEWDGEIDGELKYYKADNIIGELDETFKKLKIERDNLSKAYEVHRKLMEEVLKENDLSSIAYALHQITKIPVLIEDVNFNLIAFAGFPEQNASFASDNFKKWIHQKSKYLRDLKTLKQTLFLESSSKQKRLITPIYLDRKIVGYCSFLYEEKAPQEVDKLIIQHGALACSLYLLNERTRFNTEQRIKGKFLDDILSKQISFEEMTKRAYYIGFQLNDPYFMIAIDTLLQKPSVEEEMGFNDDLINDISIFIKNQGLNALFGQKSGKVIILLSECLLLKNKMNKENFCKSLIDYCSNKYPQYLFKVGISSNTSSIEEASQLYEECLSALRVANRHQKIIFFDSLGIEGIIFQMKNINPIQKFIYKKLGKLIEEDKNRNMEFTKTLYYYLSNGSNVHKTARAMNFSISGLRYRLQKINEILQIDINSPSVGYQMFLSLRFLIYWGELNIDLDLHLDKEEIVGD
ncbi:XylR N-terminal domain-containing protein [Aeribacillus composti]|uniref:XylR N-terminal domain-containing protein n=1 Tax=Aeribacillus composti TaxID=1868734 RepID=UPI002E230D05|nr:XylR N-terminal domain-containing protein [Aeribacillus composti]